MKLKLSLNGATIKQAAIEHGEKAGLGLALLMLILFIWSASKTETLGPDKQAEPLKKLADMTDQKIVASKWDATAKGIEVVDYPRRAKRDPLKDKDYRLASFFDKPLFEQKGKRPDPKILPVEDLLVAAGRGILALQPKEEVEPQPAAAGVARGRGLPPGGERRGHANDDRRRPIRIAQRGGNSNRKGYSWAIITGLVPVRKQEAEFEEAFRNVTDSEPDKDLPDYHGMRIERAEIVGTEEPTWVELKSRPVQEFKNRWQGETPEVIDEEYVDPIYTMPLGPLVDAQWNPAQVGHPPQIPEAERNNSASGRRKEKEQIEEKPEEEEDPGFEGFGRNPNARQGNLGGQTGRMARGPAPLGGGRGGTAKNRRKTEVTLFRFVDYTVLPGRQYRYRVKLQLMNPNFEVLERFLKDAASRGRKYAYSPWSEPTPVVTVPHDVDVFAGSAKAGREPEINVMVARLDREHGETMFGESKFLRGSIANVKEKKEEPDPEGGTITKEVPLDSHAVIVDIFGGAKLTKTLTVPGELLVLGPDGRLTLHDEMDDEEAVEAARPEESEGKKPSAGSLLPGHNPYDDMPKPKGKGDKTKKKSRKDIIKEENAAKKAEKEKKEKEREK